MLLIKFWALPNAAFTDQERNLTVLTTRTKPDVCVNGFPSFRTQISCLQYEAGFLSTSQTKYCASLVTRKYFFTRFQFGTWLSNLLV